MRRLLPLACGLLLGLLGLPASGLAAEHRLALLVGQNDGGPQAAPLFYAEADAEGMERVLEGLGDFHPGDTVVITRVGPQDVHEELRRLRRRIERLRRDDPAAEVMLLFYYSGHATPTGLLLSGQTLPFEVLREAVGAAGADVELLVLDSCFAGVAARGRRTRQAAEPPPGDSEGDAAALLEPSPAGAKGARRAPAFEVSLRPSSQTRGEVVIASSAPSELSQESDQIGGSWFTHHFRSGLAGAADRDNDGLVTLDEAYRYVHTKTLLSTAGTRAGTQNASFRTELEGRGQLVLTRTSGQAAMLDLTSLEAGTVMVFDRQRSTFLAEVELAGDQAPTSLAVGPGSYVVLRRSDDGLRVSEVDVAEGSTREVTEAELLPRAYSDDPTKGAAVRLRRRGSRPRALLSPQLGYMGVFGMGSDNLVPNTPTLGLTLALRRFLGRGFAVQLDGSAGLFVGTHTLNWDRDFAAGSVVVGGGLYWQPDLPGPASPRVGIRGSMLYLWRHFPGETDPATRNQHQLTAMPGLAGGLDLRITRTFHLAVEGRLHYLPFIESGRPPQSFGAAEVILQAQMVLP